MKHILILFVASFILAKITTVSAQITNPEHEPSAIHENKGSVGISIPVIWNNSEAIYYQLGSPKNQVGSAISYGLNVHYSRSLYKRIYGKIGVGYFRQKFDIFRPLNYIQPDGTKPLVHSKGYLYNNLDLLFGLGYLKTIDKNWTIKSSITYDWLNSFSQKYYEMEFQKWISNKKNINLGQMVSVEIGIERHIANKIFIGMDLLLPIITKWNDDKIFVNNFYSNNEKQIARNKFSIGTSVSCYYHF